MENDKISLTNLFQLQKFYLNEKFDLYLVRNFQINARDKLTSKVPSNIPPLHIQYTFPIQARPVMELQDCSYCLNIGQNQLNIVLTM